MKRKANIMNKGEKRLNLGKTDVTPLVQSNIVFKLIMKANRGHHENQATYCLTKI